MTEEYKPEFTERERFLLKLFAIGGLGLFVALLTNIAETSGGHKEEVSITEPCPVKRWE